jgi:hypothetical protein
MATLLQFVGSLIAILALAWLARRLGLGGDRRIASDDEARELAEEALCGFDGEEVAIDRSGTAALVRDREGRILLLRRHGAHFASRLLGPDVAIRREADRLTFATLDRRFGDVTLDLGPAAADWASRLERARG